MELRLDPAHALPPRSGPAAADDESSARGSFRGETVQVLKKDGLSSDAAEEISLHFAERAEQEDFDEALLEAPAPLQVMTAEQVLSYLQAAQQDADAEKLVALARRLLTASGHPGALARQAFDDPTRQYLALQFALQQGQSDGADPVRLEALRDALADLEDDAGRQIHARLNTVAAAATQGALPVAAFQQAYDALLLGQPTLATTLQLALQRFGSGGFASGLKGLIAALGADLAAARPSTSMVRLQALLQDLYQLEVVATVLDGATALVDSLARRHGVSGLAAERVVQDLVALSGERWVAASRFETLARQWGVEALGGRIALLSGVKALLRDLPVGVFVDADARQTLRAAVQDALDAAIAVEDQR